MISRIKIANVKLLVAGLLLILLGAVINSTIASRYLSSDGILTDQGLKSLLYSRLISIALGFLLVFVSIWPDIFGFLKISNGYTRTLKYVTGCWIGLFLLYRLFSFFGVDGDLPNYFPISIFRFAGHPQFWPGLIVFLALLILVFIRYEKFSPLIFLCIGILFIVSGNLVQGGPQKAFVDPVTGGNKQYYHQALLIDDGVEWLEKFNHNQESRTLLNHSETHPPFATLLHFYLLKPGSRNGDLISGTLSFIAALSLILIYFTCREIGIDSNKAGFITVLFSVIPAYNIYSAVSLDGCILTFSMVALCGIVLVVNRGIHIPGIVMIVVGIILTNLLSFSGLFWFALLFLLGIFRIKKMRCKDLFFAWIITVFLFAALILVFRLYYNYNQVAAFLTASKIENPHGFYLFAEPVKFLFTRIENISEILFFLSFGVVAILFQRDVVAWDTTDTDDQVTIISISGFIVLMLMFLAGAYKTGETARICLFITPFFILLLRRVKNEHIATLCLLAGGQTLFMQMIGSYFW